MSRGAVEALALDIYDAANRRDFDSAVQMVSEALELRNIATGEVLHGRAGFLQFARGWSAAFPDSSGEVLRVVSTEDSATVELMIRGTHTGTLIGAHGHIPPTWAQIELPVCDILHFRDGLIARVDRYFDTGNLLRQMGLFPNSPLHAPERRASLELYALEAETSVQQRNKATIRRFVEQVMNRHAPDAVADFHIANVAWHGGPMGEAHDLDGYQRHLASLFRAFPDLRIELIDVVAEHDRVAVRATLSGTHRGAFRGVPATGKRVSGTAATSYRIVDGRVAEEWWHHDLFGILQQIDAIPSALSAASAGG